MDCNYYKMIFLLLSLLQLAVGQIQKSSLTFVIDDTYSMHDDIAQVKYGVNLIFDAVLNSNASQIENFVLITFNDPGVNFRTATKDRNVFKNTLDGILVHGGDDCPELAMAGIELALEKSLPGSFLYVLTDASAKDHELLEKIQNLALKKFSQVVFLLTGKCNNDDDDPKYQAYYKLADATNGQVFHMTKDNIGVILKYVAEMMSSRKTVVTTKNFPPGYGHNTTIPVDSDMKDLVFAVSGTDPKIDITAPGGSKPHTETIVDLPKVVAVKINDTKHGIYTAEVGSKSDTSVVVTATTSIQFKHGFSTFVPASINSTSIKPLPDQESHLSIQLLSTEDVAVLNTVILTDLKENVIVEIPLKLIDAEQKLYDTALFIPPNSLFIITVKGYDKKSKSVFTRTSSTPVEPQKSFLEKPENRRPTLLIEGGKTIYAEYNEPLKLTCRINGFPRPDALWVDSNSSVLPSAYSTLDMPYDFVNVFLIDKVLNNETYSCKATNIFGEVSETVQVMTLKKEHFNIIEVPKDTTIKYRHSGQITCKIDAEPTAKIKWFSRSKELSSNNYIDISSDHSMLTIKDMRKHLNGTFACKAESGTNMQQFIFNVFISGFKRPTIDKTETKTSSRRGEDAKISCRTIEGEPTPEIIWYHMTEEETFKRLDENHEVIYFPNVDEDKAGIYTCRAKNAAGHDHHIIEMIVEYPPTINDAKTYSISTEGKDMTLECPTQGVPKPKVAWFFNGDKIFSDRTYHIYRDNKLRFTGSMRNAGFYTCVASNHLGSVNKTIRVDHFVPVSITPPKESMYEVREGDSLKLPCEAYGYPQPILNWVFFSSANNKPLPRKIRPSDVSGQLDLKNLMTTQDGFYTCVASNTKSSANITYLIKLIVPPKIEKVPTSDLPAVIGDLVMRIPCKATGYPKPEITWLRSGLNVASGTEWYSVQEDGTLVIKNLDEKSAGAYVCKANNDYGVDMHTFFVTVKPSPDTAITKTLYLEKGESGEIECSVPHTILDSIRWYKDKTPLGMRVSVKLENAKFSDDGLYTCRVSNFDESLSETTRVEIGYKPRFVAETGGIINFNDGMPALLDCDATGVPQPQVTWYNEAEKIDSNDSIYEMLMTYDERGTYTCVVSNRFGRINRTFEISSRDCLLNIEEDFVNKPPLMIDEDTLKLSQFENYDGYLRIPSNKAVILHCPDGFANFPTSKVTAICERETQFLVDGYIFNYSDLYCQEEVQPTIKRTGKHCTSKNTEQIKIGYDFLGEFLETFEVCVNKDNNLPVYAKQEMFRSLADVETKHSMWQHESFPVTYDEIYQCDTQIFAISSILQKWFHNDDKCCFNERQLVNTRDLSGGLHQRAALSYLNVIPHWSTCNGKNWDELENRVRKLAKSSFENLLVWTGSSGQLTMKNSTGGPKNITLLDTHGQQIPVPLYLWKVIQNPSTKSSLAVVQLNTPEILTAYESYKQMICKDICRDIDWMSEFNWRDTSKGSYTFCCSLPEFERAFGFTGHFGSGSYKILKNISDVLDYSS